MGVFLFSLGRNLLSCGLSSFGYSNYFVKKSLFFPCPWVIVDFHLAYQVLMQGWDFVYNVHQWEMRTEGMFLSKVPCCICIFKAFPMPWILLNIVEWEVCYRLRQVLGIYFCGIVYFHFSFCILWVFMNVPLIFSTSKQCSWVMNGSREINILQMSPRI